MNNKSEASQKEASLFYFLDQRPATSKLQDSSYDKSTSIRLSAHLFPLSRLRSRR